MNTFRQRADFRKIGQEALWRATRAAFLPRDDVRHGAAVHREHDTLAVLDRSDHARRLVPELPNRHVRVRYCSHFQPYDCPREKRALANG